MSWTDDKYPAFVISLNKLMNFIIVADSFDDRKGGNIVLHLLAERLSEIGEAAFLWPIDRPRLQFWRNPRRYLGWVRYHTTRRQRRFDKGPFITSLANSRDLSNAVIVYPELIAGNPLAARNVVRWLLHKPGFHSGKVNYGSDDLLFYYQDAFYDPSLGDYRDNRLVLTWWNKEYRQINHHDRFGSCYLVKKGKNLAIQHDLTDSIMIDRMSHREKMETFNRTKHFYTYDPYTLYARYAALCGCIPIVMPQPGMTREQWVPYEKERYGLAYGEEDIDWAVATRDLLLRQMELERAMEDDMLQAFVRKCYAKFG